MFIDHWFNFAILPADRAAHSSEEYRSLIDFAEMWLIIRDNCCLFFVAHVATELTNLGTPS